MAYSNPLQIAGERNFQQILLERELRQYLIDIVVDPLHKIYQQRPIAKIFHIRHIRQGIGRMDLTKFIIEFFSDKGFTRYKPFSESGRISHLFRNGVWEAAVFVERKSSEKDIYEISTSLFDAR